MQSEEALRAALEQVNPPTPLSSETTDYVVDRIMRARAVLSKLFSGQAEQMDEVFIELILTSRMPRVRQWWVQDARLRCVSLGRDGNTTTISTLGLTSVSRVDLNMKWPIGIGKLTIRDMAGYTTVIRQTVRFQHCAPLDLSHLAPRVRRFLSLANILQSHVI